MVRVWRRVVEPPTEWSVHSPNAGNVVIDPAKLRDFVRDDEDSPRFVTAYPGVGV
jgi:hypothetical protein